MIIIKRSRALYFSRHGYSQAFLLIYRIFSHIIYILFILFIYCFGKEKVSRDNVKSHSIILVME